MIYNTDNYPEFTTGYQTTDTWLDWRVLHTVGGSMVPGSILLDCIFFSNFFLVKGCFCVISTSKV